MMWILVPALLALGSALVCPDGGECEGNNTCCKDAAGRAACCPLPREQQLRAVVCPDRESECPDGTTCCQLADGSWGCCLFPEAVCCKDKRHCCPEGTTCDLQHARCQSATRGSSPMLEKRPARRTGNHSAPSEGSVVPPVGSVVPPVGSVVPPVGSVTCPGGESSCPDGYTCCLQRGGAYGCCPYAQALCCSDQLHCCPPDTECDLEHGVCKADGAASETAPLRRLTAASGDVECPDATWCPAQTTCCKTSSGEYGCCPMPNAVCCSDLLHCCPEGTDCDVAHGACINGRGESAVAVTTLEDGAVVPCDGSVVCAAGSTCCTLPDGAWACCSLPQAVCCEDHLHCCPHATVCNLEASTCDDAAAGTATPWHAKGPASPRHAKGPASPWHAKGPASPRHAKGPASPWHAVGPASPWHAVGPASPWHAVGPASPAPDAKCDESASCPERSTCCRTQAGGWACCPMPQAVCCSDLLHCCPHATVCNLEAETCDDPTGATPPARWGGKTPAVTSETSEAVCCGDGLHCCPEGHACEPHRSACSRGGGVAVPWLSKLSAAVTPGGAEDVKCDDRSSCAAGTTCCKLLTGGWGCCPLVQAVCCADREHCCPQGYTCNMETGTCEKASGAGPPRPLSTVVRPDDAQEEEEEAGTVPCGTAGGFRCSERDTCCRVSASEWACCPSPQAVCCPDSRHCCPAGHACDPGAAGCSPLSWAAPLGVRGRL